MGLFSRILQHVKGASAPTYDPTKAVLLVDLGGPETPGEYRNFLVRMFSDPNVLPVFAPLRWWIRRSILKKRLVPGWERYVANGGSPLKRAASGVAKSLSAALGGEQVGCAWIYGDPQIPETVGKMAKMGIKDLAILPLNPHGGRATRVALRRVLDRIPANPDLRLSVVLPYGDSPRFVNFWVRLIKETAFAEKMSSPHLLFAAHSVPKNFASKYGDSYAAEIEASCKAIALVLGLPWSLGWSSAMGNRRRWIGPSVEEALDEAAKTASETLIVPVSFMTENMETVADLGNELDRNRWPSLRIARVRLPDGVSECPAKEELEQLLLALVQSARDE